MSSFGPARPSVRDILAGPSAHGPSSSLSETDMAQLLVEYLPPGARAGNALGKRLGVKNTARAARVFMEPYATVVFALAQALQHLGLHGTALYDTPQGCVVEASLPFDMLSFGGQLMFEVVDRGVSETRIEGTSVIAGQIFAWGKGKRTLKAALDATQEYMTRHRV